MNTVNNVNNEYMCTTCTTCVVITGICLYVLLFCGVKKIDRWQTHQQVRAQSCRPAPPLMILQV